MQYTRTHTQEVERSNSSMWHWANQIWWRKVFDKQNRSPSTSHSLIRRRAFRVRAQTNTHIHTQFHIYSLIHVNSKIYFTITGGPPAPQKNSGTGYTATQFFPQNPPLSSDSFTKSRFQPISCCWFQRDQSEITPKTVGLQAVVAAESNITEQEVTSQHPFLCKQWTLESCVSIHGLHSSKCTSFIFEGSLEGPSLVRMHPPPPSVDGLAFVIFPGCHSRSPDVTALPLANPTNIAVIFEYL